MIEEFKRQYVEKCIFGDGFDDELKHLFQTILNTEFKDGAEKMSNLVESIIDEHQKMKFNKVIKSRTLVQEGNEVRNELDSLWLNLYEIVKEIRKGGSNVWK